MSFEEKVTSEPDIKYVIRQMQSISKEYEKIAAEVSREMVEKPNNQVDYLIALTNTVKLLAERTEENIRNAEQLRLETQTLYNAIKKKKTEDINL